MRRNFFVDPGPARSVLLKMEHELVHKLKEDIADSVLNEDAVRQYVEDLKEAQDAISRDNPKLRRVEISTTLDDKHWHPEGTPHFITIGQYCCPLRPVNKIV